MTLDEATAGTPEVLAAFMRDRWDKYPVNTTEPRDHLVVNPQRMERSLGLKYCRVPLPNQGVVLWMFTCIHDKDKFTEWLKGERG